MDEKELNEQQLQAVFHIAGPLLVIAGAGSGKTRVITHRIAHLIKLGIQSDAILAVTFTNKAADEMKERIKKITGNSTPWISTFHSFGAKLLRESSDLINLNRNFIIYDEDDSLKLLKEVIKELNLDEKEIKTYHKEIVRTKEDLIDVNSLGDKEKRIFDLYNSKLKAYGGVDFADLLFLPVQLLRNCEAAREFWQKRFSFLMVDEYQDTNMVQNELIKLLASPHNNVFVVGDPDQSIYSWRGARYQNIYNFSQNFEGAKIVTLEHNYRSTSTILSAANALIANNEMRYPKNLWSRLGDGEKITVYFAENEKREAAFVAKAILEQHERGTPLDEIAVLYRTNAQSRVLEENLVRGKIPFVILGGVSFYERREIKDIISFLRLAILDNDFLSFKRTINIPKRGIGRVMIEKLKAFSEEMQLPILQACERAIDQKGFFTVKQKGALKEYLNFIIHLKDMAKGDKKIGDLIEEICFTFKYLDYLKEEDEETFEERKENIGTLVAKGFEWEEENNSASLNMDKNAVSSVKKDLAAFLEDLSLISSRDLNNEDRKSVKLMTLHTSKGTEFICALMVGMEEGLFPHLSAIDTPFEMEEERRLCYVGMTRVKRFLYLTASSNRNIWGEARGMRPSRFLQEIPKEFCKIVSSDFTNDNFEAMEEFQVGDKLYHPSYGKGVVQSTYTTSLGPTYDILFDIDLQVRSIVSAFAALKREI